VGEQQFEEQQSESLAGKPASPQESSAGRSAGEVISVAIEPQVVIPGGRMPSGWLTLSKKAPPGGSVVALTSSRPDIIRVPSQFQVAEGSLNSSFEIEVLPVAKPEGIVVTASFGGVSVTTALIVWPSTEPSAEAIDRGLSAAETPTHPGIRQVTLNFSEQAYATLTNLAGDRSLTDLFRDAIALKLWFEQTRADGGHILVEQPVGQIQEVISV
jgi:hypothetical protein